uniref:Uncharacterized protein n=1 Tax=Arundo donax TaxID=35708 RepID=A0A0A9B1T8_ARUDO
MGKHLLVRSTSHVRPYRNESITIRCLCLLYKQ